MTAAYQVVSTTQELAEIRASTVSAGVGMGDTATNLNAKGEGQGGRASLLILAPLLDMLPAPINATTLDKAKRRESEEEPVAPTGVFVRVSASGVSVTVHTTHLSSGQAAADAVTGINPICAPRSVIATLNVSASDGDVKGRETATRLSAGGGVSMACDDAGDTTDANDTRELSTTLLGAIVESSTAAENGLQLPLEGDASMVSQTEAPA